jgi:hypothetical protein
MTLQHTTLRHTTLHSSHDTTTTTATTLHWLHYTQLQLHYTTTTAALHHTNYIQQLWLQPLQPIQKTPLQQPFGPSVDSLCHPWFTTTNLTSPRGFLFLKLPPRPCAVLLVWAIIWIWLTNCKKSHVVRFPVAPQAPGETPCSDGQEHFPLVLHVLG